VWFKVQSIVFFFCTGEIFLSKSEIQNSKRGGFGGFQLPEPRKKESKN
jgi:hypothetical protein